MMNSFNNLSWGMMTPFTVGTFSSLIFIIVLWSLFWKGLALWHSAQRKQHVWFILLLFINTLGILEIIYLFAVAEIKAKDLFKK